MLESTKRRTRHLRRWVGLLMAVTVLGLTSGACARVQSHFALPDLAMGDPAFGPTIEAYTATRVAGGNRVDLLLNGDEIFPAILEAIGSAQRTITYAQYFYEEGEMPRQIATALADRCRSGIRAHILLDGFGALLMPAEYREMMTSAGCEVITFRPLSPLVLLSPFGLGRENNRSHRRILVVDGRIGFTGGVGVSPKWLGNGRSKGLWRQTDVRIEGPVVASLQGAFVENWLEATGNVLGGETSLCDALIESLENGLALCREAVIREPDNVFHYRNLGSVLLLAGKTYEALETFREGLQIRRDEGIIRKLDALGTRKPPVFKFLSRQNFLNKSVGFILNRLGFR